MGKWLSQTAHDLPQRIAFSINPWRAVYCACEFVRAFRCIVYDCNSNAHLFRFSCDQTTRRSPLRGLEVDGKSELQVQNSRQLSVLPSFCSIPTCTRIKDEESIDGWKVENGFSRRILPTRIAL